MSKIVLPVLSVPEVCVSTLIIIASFTDGLCVEAWICANLEDEGKPNVLKPLLNNNSTEDNGHWPS